VPLPDLGRFNRLLGDDDDSPDRVAFA